MPLNARDGNVAGDFHGLWGARRVPRASGPLEFVKGADEGHIIYQRIELKSSNVDWEESATDAGLAVLPGLSATFVANSAPGTAIVPANNIDGFNATANGNVFDAPCSLGVRTDGTFGGSDLVLDVSGLDEWGVAVSRTLTFPTAGGAADIPDDEGYAWSRVDTAVISTSAGAAANVELVALGRFALKSVPNVQSGPIPVIAVTFSRTSNVTTAGTMVGLANGQGSMYVPDVTGLVGTELNYIELWYIPTIPMTKSGI